MGNKKSVRLIVYSVGLSLLLSIVADDRFGRIADSVITQGIALACSAVIAALGIMFGGLGWLGEAIRKKSSSQMKDRIEFLESFSKIMKELKANTQFLLVAVAAAVLIPVLRDTDLPYVSWPISITWLSKQIVLNALLLSMFLLSLCAVNDLVKTMFIAYEMWSTATKSHLKASVKGNELAPVEINCNRRIR